MSKKVLITQQALRKYGGSEVVTLEMTKELISKGFSVDIMTMDFGLPMSEEFANVNVIGINEDINLSDYSHMWIHHSLLPVKILNNLEGIYKHKIKVAFHHMSMYVNIEAPLIRNVEMCIADKIYFNSEETKNSLESRFNIKGEVFSNPAPDEFFSDNKGPVKAINKVLVVSNHPPQEIIEALDDLVMDKMILDYDVFGEKGDFKLVTPELINMYDSVISIGKTVQYCLASHIPVFCYDHFGGPGYISRNNYDKARHHNFSGRGFSRHTKARLYKMIIDVDAANKQSEIDSKILEEFRLSKRIQDFFGDSNKSAFKMPTIYDIEQAKAIISQNIEIIRLANVVEDQKMEINRIKNEEMSLQSDLKKALCDKGQIEAKYSKTLGRRALSVARRLKAIVK